VSATERAAVWVLLAIAFGLASASIALPALADEPEGDRQRIVISGMTFVAGSGSRNELVLWAEKAYVDTQRQVVDLEQLHVSLAGDGERPSVDLRCRRGQLDLATNDIRLEGDVRGRTDDGRSFRTEWLGYEEAGELLYTDAVVELRESGALYRGGGLRLEVEARRLRLLEGVHVVREQ
jgi:LPS export ABC transporter protein LptC